MHLAVTFRTVAADIYTVVMMSYQFSNHGSYLATKHFSISNSQHRKKLRKPICITANNLFYTKITVNRVAEITDSTQHNDSFSRCFLVS